MKKLVTVLGTVLAVAFSSAAMSGVCTKEKLAGRYVISGTTDENNHYFGAGGLYRVFLNSNGRGFVKAYAGIEDGYIVSDNVQWPIEWDVAEDCTGGLFIADGRGGINALFAASGSVSRPVLTGVGKSNYRGMTGLWRAERVDF
jgi:hypothetical protein